ncbi:MAG: fibronectin type III domain-containing protein [Candidatus Levybacteria bacterium]|nr:fibronectin type III domain-containing protein [Candidatus Levybacteria bacterium]
MRESFWNKKIPTVLGLILIVIGIGVTTFLVREGGIFSIRAGPSHDPQQVRISNITDNSFTVSYYTEDKVTGALSFGESQSLEQSALDDRDQNLGSVNSYNIHNFTVRRLNPQTKYYFSIISSKDTYLNNSNPFEVTTGSVIENQPSSQNPASGKIFLPTSQSPKEAIVYLTTQNSQVVSTLTKNDGTFLLPLNSLRTSDLKSYFKLEEGQLLKILAYGEGLSSNVVLLSKQSDPVPFITLSNDYDFTINTIPTATSSATTQFPSFSSSLSQEVKKNPQILTPQKDQSFIDQKPEFKGTAPANETVQIIINSQTQIKADVKTDNNGNWKYRPPQELSVGEHTITIIAKDSLGSVKTITQAFTVNASGSQVSGESGSPTPTKSQTPTQTPTLTLSPTSGITQTPTITPTLSVASPTPTTPLPPTGNATIITAGIIGLLLTLMGGLLLLVSRKTL